MLRIAACALTIGAGIGVVAKQSSAQGSLSSLKSSLVAIEASFARSSSVSFYFVARTEKYRLSDQELIRTATLRVTRECGNNCASFMKRVVTHLKSAQKVPCLPGQEDVLIVPKQGPSLLFSYSGRVLKYGSECFFTKAGVDSILKSDGFFFN